MRLARILPQRQFTDPKIRYLSKSANQISRRVFKHWGHWSRGPYYPADIRINITGRADPWAYKGTAEYVVCAK
jgi:hypothetical protein